MAASAEQTDHVVSDAEEPACWSWPDPGLPDRDAERAKMLAINAAALAPGGDPDDRYDDVDGILDLLIGNPYRYRWYAFHDDRCAICGSTPRRLSNDHDHATGLVRGLLCRSCNLREGHGWDGVFELYRQRPPAVILGYRGYYVGFGWLPRWWENRALGRHLTGDPSWERIDGVAAA